MEQHYADADESLLRDRGIDSSRMDPMVANWLIRLDNRVSAGMEQFFSYAANLPKGYDTKPAQSVDLLGADPAFAAGVPDELAEEFNSWYRDFTSLSGNGN